MKQLLVQIPDDYMNAKKKLQGIKYRLIDDCIRHRTLKQVTAVVDEANLKQVEEIYAVKILGDVAEINREKLSMVGKGDRFEKDILEAKII